MWCNINYLHVTGADTYFIVLSLSGYGLSLFIKVFSYISDCIIAISLYYVTYSQTGIWDILYILNCEDTILEDSGRC